MQDVGAVALLAGAAPFGFEGCGFRFETIFEHPGCFSEFS
jgi:hypothetical protein